MPSAATDAFSLGRTFAAVVPQEQRPPDLKQLIEGMCADDARSRMLASTAVNDRYFQPLFASEELRTCSICMDESRYGITCSEAHFTCATCVTDHVHHACVDELQARRRREGRVVCPKAPRECSAAPFLDKDLARHLPDAVFAEYSRSREELIEARMNEEKDASVKEAVEAERRRVRELSERKQRIDRVRMKIVDEVLTMTCPKGHAYLDFNGCCALRCGHCGLHFCAWCLQGSADDNANHAHVRQCPSKPQGVDPYFPSPRSAFDEHWRIRKAAGVKAAMQSLRDQSEVQELLAQLRPQLADLKL